MDENVKVMYLMNVDMKLKHTDAQATHATPSSAWCSGSASFTATGSVAVVGSSGAASLAGLASPTLISIDFSGPRRVDE
ncbi:unnamed protein product [Phytophthora lilii]|uniref:Unnamed protein product n=1 Tax=Phytophthora lilii TaxID=2077276 RepID=A0A9W6UBY3_9STRA|nr:unnamed protein product [Phytophthora lilii]